MTRYRIRTDSPSPSWLSVLKGDYYCWSGLKLASIFENREQAIEAARTLARLIGANGYPGVRLLIVPATGGAPIGTSFSS